MKQTAMSDTDPRPASNAFRNTLQCTQSVCRQSLQLYDTHDSYQPLLTEWLSCGFMSHSTQIRSAQNMACGILIPFGWSQGGYQGPLEATGSRSALSVRRCKSVPIMDIWLAGRKVAPSGNLQLVGYKGNRSSAMDTKCDLAP